MDETSAKDRENQPRWDGRPGFYEVWYLKWNDVATRTAGWVRYTLTAPAAGLSDGPVGELWGMFFDAGDPGGNFAAKQTWPSGTGILPVRVPDQLLDQARQDHGPEGRATYFISLPGGSLGRRAVGRVHDGSGRQFSWDLSFDSVGPPFRHLPLDWMYTGGWPKTKPVSPHQDARLSGVVTIDGRQIALRDAPGQQTHIWGRRHALSWAWGHCNVFKEGEAVWEGLSSRVAVGPWASPPLSLHFLRHGGREHRFNTVASLLQNRGRWEIGSWSFVARAGEWELNGEARTEPERVITVTYTDPGGDKLWCRNSKLASLTLGLRERGKLRATLSADETAAVEFVDRRLRPGEKVWL